jgi:hypothetical protein
VPGAGAGAGAGGGAADAAGASAAASNARASTFTKAYGACFSDSLFCVHNRENFFLEVFAQFCCSYLL